MNTRLQHRLTEPEVLKIFSDVIQGVACMHYLQPPLIHRDLKVENVLIAPTGGYKVCDFGSCSPVKPAPQTTVECRLLEEDIQKHTTLQYRSPEMVDVYRKLPIDEKSDIWALGVLLYKLCYYTTPFEEQGTLAILNASYTFPAHPIFSDRLKNLIGGCCAPPVYAMDIADGAQRPCFESILNRDPIYTRLFGKCATSGAERCLYQT
jgi:AP2-associated kinase